MRQPTPASLGAPPIAHSTRPRVPARVARCMEMGADEQPESRPGLSVRLHASRGLGLLTVSVQEVGKLDASDYRAAVEDTYEELALALHELGLRPLSWLAHDFPHLDGLEIVTADLCRSELFVEIEAVAALRP